MIRGDQHNAMRCLALPILSSLLLVSCAGDLTNPEDFIGGAGGSPGQSVEGVFLVNCGNPVCHDSDQPAADLDLVSPNVASRTVDVNSVEPNCGSEIIVIAGDPDESYMMKKILNAPGICGGQMPLGTILGAEETEVIRQWIIDLGAIPSIINEGPDSGV
jgi:hypothetical protein